MLTRRNFIASAVSLAAACGLRVRPTKAGVADWHCKTCGAKVCRGLPECRVAFAEERMRQAEQAYTVLTGAVPPNNAGWAGMVEIPEGPAPGQSRESHEGWFRGSYHFACEQNEWYCNAFWAQKRRAEEAERVLLSLGVVARNGDWVHV